MENRRHKENFDAGQTRRVEVYRLSEDGKWEDHGTGHVTVDYLERSEDLGFLVVDEEDNETLLVHRISPDDIYRKQEDTIISWKDSEYSTELALSFQEIAGCAYLWDHICNVQRSLHFGTLNHDTFHSVNSELRELPAVELSTLPLILKIVAESGITDQMRVTELILHDQEFFRKLMDLFRICEDLENLDSLHIIYKIVKGIVMLNSPQIFEKVFGDELIMDIIGCLEYDPEVSHVRHRDFLKEHVIFKEAIPIKDSTVLSKIHQTYRISYLKDVVLPRVLDDATVASLNSMVHANNGVVVSLLKEDSAFIQELFSRLRSSSIVLESKKNLVYFLHEFCTLSKSLQMVQQLRLFRDLVALGLFDIISDILRNEDKRLVLTGTDILLLFLNQDPNLLRSYVVRPEGAPILGLLVQGMLTDFGDDMHCQFLEILRILLDPYTSSGSQRDTIIEIFYERHLDELIDVITSCSGGNGLANSAAGTSIKHRNTKPEILLNICELLCFCVVHHTYRIKCYFLHSSSMDKILYLTRRREKYLVVAAVRFVRTVVSRNDDTLNNYIIKRNLLKPIVDAFVANGDRYNLLNSVVLELFEYILKENLKSLIKYLIETFWSQLGKFDYLVSIKSLQVRYEQSQESIEAKPAVNMDSRKRVEERALEREEEDYFNEDSDEEDTASASASMPQTQRAKAESMSSNGSAPSSPTLSSRSGGLVDYDDDEDDVKYKPPPRRYTDASDGNEATLETLTAKRKMASKEGHGLAKKHRLDKSSKSKDSMFASLCSTLSQTVLPNKKAASIVHNASHLSSTKSTVKEEEEAEVCRSRHDENSCSEEENGSDKNVASRNCPGTLSRTHEIGKLEGKDHPHIPSNSSPEMTVNGS